MDCFDAYLAALVQNIGKIVQLKVIDNYLKIENPPRSVEFLQSFDSLAYRLALQVVSSWDFPSGVVTALNEQINSDKSEAVSPLGSVLSRANSLGMLLLLEEVKRIKIDPERFVAKTGDNEDGCALCYKEFEDISSDSRLS